MTYHAKSDFSGWVNFAKIEKIAAKIRAKDPTLTKEQAIAKAAEENPRLHEAYSEEVRKDLTGGY